MQWSIYVSIKIYFAVLKIIINIDTRVCEHGLPRTSEGTVRLTSIWQKSTSSLHKSHFIMTKVWLKPLERSCVCVSGQELKERPTWWHWILRGSGSVFYTFCNVMVRTKKLYSFGCLKASFYWIILKWKLSDWYIHF